MTYRIDWTDGRTEVYPTMARAHDALRLALGEECEIGHDGDLSDGGARTLVWASAEDAEDDDGTRAVAQITRAPAPEAKP